MIDLSVHLITFNNQNHIEETIRSILSQKVDFNYEIVVGDDCSSDNTLEIINTFQSNKSELFNVKKNDSQLGILRNFKTTLDRCRGSYVLALAGDDLLKNEHSLQTMFDVFKHDNSLGFIDVGFDKYYEATNKTVKFANKKFIESDKKAYREALLLGRVPNIGICFNRKLLLKCVDFETYLNKNITIDDYPVLVDMVMQTNFKTIHESLITYRVHEKSFSHKKEFKSQYKASLQMKMLFDYFAEKYDFETTIIETYHKTHMKHLLFLAGFFEKKELGKEIFLKINPKTIKDYIHFFASQNKLFRKLVSII